MGLSLGEFFISFGTIRITACNYQLGDLSETRLQQTPQQVFVFDDNEANWIVQCIASFTPKMGMEFGGIVFSALSEERGNILIQFKDKRGILPRVIFPRSLGGYL